MKKCFNHHITLIIFLYSIFCIVTSSTCHCAPEKKFYVLCLDGGGVRGIIPARILQEFEERTGKHTSELFDLVVGNSAGGILSLALVTPDRSGAPKYTAQDLVNFFRVNSGKIFYRSFTRRMGTGWGVWGAKYNRSAIDEILRALFLDVTLSQTLKPVVITSYSLDKELPHLWTTDLARKDPNHDFYLRDIAGATSAAPTFFPPKKLRRESGEILHEIDGGIWANDPALTAFVHLVETKRLKMEDIVLISIGTGEVKKHNVSKQLVDSGDVGWITSVNLIDIMIDANTEWAKTMVSKIFPNTYRLQVIIPNSLDHMDNASEENIQALLKKVDLYIKDNETILNEISDMLLLRASNR